MIHLFLKQIIVHVFFKYLLNLNLDLILGYNTTWFSLVMAKKKAYMLLLLFLMTFLTDSWTIIFLFLWVLFDRSMDNEYQGFSNMVSHFFTICYIHLSTVIFSLCLFGKPHLHLLFAMSYFLWNMFSFIHTFEISISFIIIFNPIRKILISLFCLLINDVYQIYKTLIIGENRDFLGPLGIRPPK